MADAESILEIDRRLLREDETAREPVILDQSEIADLDGPIVILGDPGLGKSVLTRALGRLDGFVYVRAASFVRHAQPERFIPNGECLVIDGLDEIASATVGGGVDAILSQLSKLGFPRFILSSREVDWRGATDRIKIEDDYGLTATLLHLQPFDRKDAEHSLARNFPAVVAHDVLKHLSDRGLEDIYKNPLTLRLIGEIAASDEALPNSRAELLERACRLLVEEDNPRHQDAAHVQSSTQDLLLAAGAHAAAQLLCNLAGVFSGPAGKTPDSYVHVAVIAALPHAKAAEQALHTRLFEAEGGSRFCLLHRVVAEYLGAQWLAHCFKAGGSARRILRLFGQGHGIPTSLRGLHAWIAHFDSVLAETCITADPYAVLRYGDAENLPVRLARQLLAALVALSDRDPFFRTEDWGEHPASALIKLELRDDILAVISTPDQHTHLTMLLVEVMAGSPLAAALKPQLTEMMFDPARYYAERMRAAAALREIGAIDDPVATIERLLAQGSEDGPRLAWELLHDLGLASAPMDLVIRAMFAHIELTVRDVDRSEDRLNLAHFADSSIEALSLDQLVKILDLAHDYAEPLFDDAKHSAKAQVADLVRLAGLRALNLDPTMAPADIWRRFRWVDHNQGYKRETTQALTDWFKARTDIRRAVQAYAIFDAGLEHVRDASFAFYECGLRLYPDEADVIALIEEFDRRSGATDLDYAMLEELVLLAPRRDGSSDEVRTAAAQVGAQSPAFLAKLEELSKPIVYEWQIKQEAESKKREAERAAAHQSFRDKLSEDLPAVDSGAPNLLYNPAIAYLGGYADFDKEAPPEDRVREFLGPELAERVLAGFMAAFQRNDLPSAADIVAKHIEGQFYYVELPLICGVAERLRRGMGLADLSVEACEAAFMAWRRTGESRFVGGMDMKPLEAAALSDDAAIERFFRTWIEAQLEAKRANVCGLYSLAHDARWSALAGRLAVEWLRCFPSLPDTIETDLLNCATRHAGRAELQALARDTRTRMHSSHDMMLAWLSLDFLVDFEVSRVHLETAATDHPEFLWFIRNRISGERDDPQCRLSVDQRIFIVERFSHTWSKMSRPQGASQGDTNPWDASTAIENSGYALGGDPSAEATAALERLIGLADPSYGDSLRHALALQLRARRDSEFAPVLIESLAAVARGDLPTTVDDMRAFFADRMATLQAKMHSTATDMWEAYWESKKPRVENFCRNRLVEHISSQLPEAIRFAPEMHMPLQKRADIAAILGNVGLPVEIKRQWHSEVWIAPVKQLEVLYAREWHAKGRGAYIVIWFGDVPDQAMPAHPRGLPLPQSPEAMRTMLIDLLPEALRDVIDVYVVDVSRPTNAKN